MAQRKCSDLGVGKAIGETVRNRGHTGNPETEVDLSDSVGNPEFGTRGSSTPLPRPLLLVLSFILTVAAMGLMPTNLPPALQPLSAGMQVPRAAPRSVHVSKRPTDDWVFLFPAFGRHDLASYKIPIAFQYTVAMSMAISVAIA